MPDLELDGPEPDRPDDPDWSRRLLDGYAAPGRADRLAERQRRDAAAGRVRRLVRRLSLPWDSPARGDRVGKRAAWRWGNVPLPEAHLVGLGVGVLLQVVAPWRLSWSAWIGHACGWPLILAGLGLAASAVRAAADVDLERPNQLIRRGPYTFSRNPMYVAWTLVYVGIALVTSAVWSLLLLPIVLLATHVVVRREERSLQSRFGAGYRSYKASVRRYL
jgi:protein-S-isoprenylcysteine O-methyltransferase Ste14